MLDMLLKNVLEIIYRPFTSYISVKKVEKHINSGSSFAADASHLILDFVFHIDKFTC